MKTYVSHKEVQAEPMSKVVANSVGLVRDFDGVDSEGYKVVYEDGYESWSPKDAFDKGYTEVTDV